MNSEKVKEIKKVLEQNAKTCLLYDFEKNTDCKVFQCKYILDYINELESENKRLKQSNKNILFVNEKVINENEKLKEYIKGNEADAKTFVNGWHKDLETELKKFAETFKEKLLKPHIYMSEQIIIDEVLKEFLSE